MSNQKRKSKIELHCKKQKEKKIDSTFQNSHNARTPVRLLVLVIELVFNTIGSSLFYNIFGCLENKYFSLDLMCHVNWFYTKPCLVTLTCIILTYGCSEYIYSCRNYSISFLFFGILILIRQCSHIILILMILQYLYYIYNKYININIIVPGIPKVWKIL